MSSTLVALRRFDAVHEAELAASALESGGIECELRDAYVGGAHPELANATGGVTLLVAPDQFDAAQELLEKGVEFGSDFVAESATCAGCGGPIENAMAACPDCNAQPDRVTMTPHRTRFAIVKLKLWLIAICFGIALAPQILEPLWRRFTDIPEKFITMGAWSLVAVIVGALLVKSFSTSDTRL